MIKDWYKLELQSPGKMKLVGSTKKLIDKTKTGENLPYFEALDVFLVQWNLVINIKESLKHYTLLPW